MNLEKIRERIDQIDYEILKILNERIELALRSKKFKGEIYDKKREDQLMKQLKNYSGILNLVQSDFVEKLFKEIIAESRKLQKKKTKLIGFQGEHGAFGEMAARVFDMNLTTIPCNNFIDVFEGVERDYFDLGIVPVENSLGGAITQANELLIKTELKVIGAVRLQISHCLLLLPESNYREIRTVYSHPQALSQCRDFLIRHQMEGRAFYDTAGAARMLSKERLKMTAVIASRLAAQLYNLDVIKENIEDNPTNFTRFLLLGKRERHAESNKCSIIFSTPHRAGSLYEVLKIFTEANVNLTRIESFPHRDYPGNYVFFLDFQNENGQESIKAILEKVKRKTKMFKYLGCYEEVYS